MYTRRDSLYCYPNSTTLKNRRGYTDSSQLAAWEAHAVAVRSAEVLRSPPPFVFSFDHLRQLHRLLFRDVYDWAGESRRVNISKGDTRFAVWEQIDGEAQRLFASTPNVPAPDARDMHGWFIRTAAPFLIELNVIHPFREGNGRAARLFAERWANTVALRLAWDEVEPEDLLEAMIDGVTNGTRHLEVALDRCLQPVI